METIYEAWLASYRIECETSGELNAAEAASASERIANEERSSSSESRSIPDLQHWWKGVVTAKYEDGRCIGYEPRESDRDGMRTSETKWRPHTVGITRLLRYAG